MHFKQDKMTPAERMDALFAYEKPDRIPVGAMSTGFNTRNAGHTVADAYQDPEKSFADMLWTTEQYGWDPIPQYAGHTVLGAWDFGGEVRMPKGEFEGALVVTRHPITCEEDVAALTLPDPKTAGRIPQAMRFSELQAEKGLPVYFFSRSPFTMAANIAGIDRFLRWTMKQPELCETLLKLSLEHIVNVLSYWVAAFGAERIFAWMSSPSESNQLVSPRTVKQFAIPYHEAYHRRLKEQGIGRFGMHICGDQNLNLPLLAESAPWPHPSVLSFGHEVDLEVAAAHFPADIIYGNIEPAVIQTGTPEQVYELCRIAIEKGKKARGGFILGPGCGLPVSAPPVNVYAMTKAAHDFSR
ncbi:MAG: uroporphyrinogen decarboxylase family protein [Desulfobacterales bacterium]